MTVDDLMLLLQGFWDRLLFFYNLDMLMHQEGAKRDKGDDVS